MAEVELVDDENPGFEKIAVRYATMDYDDTVITVEHLPGRHAIVEWPL